MRNLFFQQKGLFNHFWKINIWFFFVLWATCCYSVCLLRLFSRLPNSLEGGPSFLGQHQGFHTSAAASRRVTCRCKNDPYRFYSRRNQYKRFSSYVWAANCFPSRGGVCSLNVCNTASSSQPPLWRYFRCEKAVLVF